LVAHGRVLRAGRTLTVCRGDAVTITDGHETPVATLMSTMIAITQRPYGIARAQPGKSA
jgi:hypothetical protein